MPTPKLRTAVRISAIALLPLAGCAAPGSSDDPNCQGAKCDDPEAVVLETCVVLDAFGQTHLDPAYQYTQNGDNRADLDKALVQVTQDGDGELTVQLGDLTIEGAELLDTEVDPSTDLTAARYGFDVPESVDESGHVELRVFDDNKVGMLARKGTFGFVEMTQFDCNPANLPPAFAAAAPEAADPICEGAREDVNGACHGADGRFIPRRCCEASEPTDERPAVEINATDMSFECTVVAYDDSSSFDTAVGTAFNYFASGEGITEPGHWEVELETNPSFSDRSDDLVFGFGGLSMRREGDTFEFLGDEVVESGDTTRIVKVWQFRRDGRPAEDFVEVRIFSDSGAGTMMDADDGEAMVQLDCRTTYETPRELDFF